MDKNENQMTLEEAAAIMLDELNNYPMYELNSSLIVVLIQKGILTREDLKDIKNNKPWNAIVNDPRLKSDEAPTVNNKRRWWQL